MRTRDAVIARFGIAGAMLAAAAMASAQEYPTKPVRVISQGAVGGAVDVTTRIVADQLGRIWNQSVVVDNRPGGGGGGVVAAQAVAKSPPDGYTLFAVAASAFVIAPVTQNSLPYDPERDFAPIGFIAENPLVVGVAQTVPARTVSELIALAKREPGKIEYGANLPGSFPNLTAELFASRANVSFTFVPYKGIAPALQDMMAGRIAMVVDGIGGIAGPLKSGVLRPLAVTSARRLPNYPEIPSLAETLPGFEAIGWFALVAPAGTTASIVSKVSHDLRRAIEQPEVNAKLVALGSYPRPMTPEQLAAFIRQERERWAPVVRRMELKPQ
ncbi:MAG: Bug family tripartite tricarboxylate transporter substrate binding protein [Burkholderiales bacterium]